MNLIQVIAQRTGRDPAAVDRWLEQHTYEGQIMLPALIELGLSMVYSDARPSFRTVDEIEKRLCAGQVVVLIHGSTYLAIDTVPPINEILNADRVVAFEVKEPQEITL